MAVAEVSQRRKAEAGRAVAEAPVGLIRRAQLSVGLLRNFAYDALRFWRHSYLLGATRRPHLAARILADAHFLEYGMALSDAQPGFGRARAVRLARDLSRYAPGAGEDVTVKTGLGVLEAYLAFNAPVPEGLGPIRDAMAGLKARGAEEVRTGVEAVRRAQVQAAAKVDFLEFVRARHSVRSFVPGPRPDEEIRRAVLAAREVPSSCNRQTCHVHAYTDPALLNRVRKLQAGNRTFGHQLSGILVVTSDLGGWETIGERYQPWIDGGLFAMTLAYALHAEGLGTCMLNWSVERQQDRKLRKLMGLDDSRLVVVLIGIGWMPEEFSVCASQRLPVSEILSLNQRLDG